MKILVSMFALMLFLIPEKSFCLNIESILRSQNYKELKLKIRKHAFLKLQSQLCAEQKNKSKIPTACYQSLGKSFKKNSDSQNQNEFVKIDSWCLNLHIEDLTLDDLTKFKDADLLSPTCNKHLEQKKRIFKYRKKDFLLKKMRNYWI